MQVEIRDAGLVLVFCPGKVICLIEPETEEVGERTTAVAVGIEAREVYRSERAAAALQVRNGVGDLSRRDGHGLLGVHVLEEGEVEDDGGIAPRVAFFYDPPLFEMRYGTFLWNIIKMYNYTMLDLPQHVQGNLSFARF